ncbi:hypothetical protein CVIRNUC_001419 [Coccomyxa viridis]|uniref:MYND-type domain-containing protein n=1 Tax=Coccomyxa viridis TaxID=1274662 RepID=A0AAV1HWK2_9CHLO|nr:hypothetical protein CVIRNUC_001419 [Coccomyxa viridis]
MDGMVENHMAKSAMMTMKDYFDPFMLVNWSGTCACSRLLQGRHQGMQMVSIADKIKKEVNNPDESRFAWTGSRHGDFKLMHKAVQCLKLCESHAAIAPGSYTPILHEWEVAESIGRKLSNYGRLVFADKTTTKFVVVELCIHTCIPSKQRAEQRAHLLFCLARYLGFNPTWVRYATSTPDKPDFPKKLLKEDACKPGYWKESFQKYNFGQIDATNFKASLGENALDVMAIIIGRSANMIDRVAEAQEAFGGLDALRRDVLQTSAAARDGCPPNEAEPPTKPFPKPWMCNPVLPRLCASCGESELHRKLMKCASCQMKWYCSKACQVAHWKQGHKLYCKQEPGQAPRAKPRKLEGQKGIYFNLATGTATEMGVP